MKPTLLIDARMAASGPAHGIARYTRELVARIRGSEEWQLQLLVSKIHLEEARQHFPGLPLIGTRFGPFHPGEVVELPYLIWKLQPTMVHFTSLAVAWCPGRPYFVSVHDLIPQVCYPSRAKKLHFRFYLGPLLRRAHGIFCGSQHTLHDLKLMAGPQLQSVAKVTYYGVETLLAPRDAAEGALEVAHPSEQGTKTVATRPYLLAVTNPKPHKNAEFLLRAFAQTQLPLDLILVCRSSPGLERLVASDPRVQRLDSISDQELSLLMRRAWAVCMPSLYEGFGLPPLEGMSMGVPAIVARAASLPEVVGSQTPTFDPKDEADFVRAVHRLWEDPQLYARLREQGPKQAAQFNWERVAQGHLETYRRVYQDLQAPSSV